MDNAAFAVVPMYAPLTVCTWLFRRLADPPVIGVRTTAVLDGNVERTGTRGGTWPDSTVGVQVSSSGRNGQGGFELAVRHGSKPEYRFS